MSVTSAAVDAGQAIYSKRTLAIYDWLVLGFSNRFVWKCPTRHLLRMYNENISAHHLDVGVGSGFFLDRCHMPSDKPRIALLDLNRNCLDTAAHRIARYKPDVFQANILEPVDISAAKFHSVSINYVLHCLPGTMKSKAIVFENLKALMDEGGVLFGSTILHDGLRSGRLAKQLMKFYNGKNIFTNTHDDLQTLQDCLHAHFSKVSITSFGCVALFVARNE